MSHVSLRPDGGLSLIGFWEMVKGYTARVLVRLAAKGWQRFAEVIRSYTALKLHISLRVSLDYSCTLRP